MQAAILEAPGRFAVGDHPLPEPGPGEVRVRTAVCGMCTSELDMFEGVNPALSYPRFLGHEPAGVVDAVGEGVEGLREGDRVVLYAEGAGYAEYVVVPAAWVVKLGPDVPFEHALGEPIACSVNGVRKVDPEIGDSVALVGCGFMGLVMLQVFKARGAGLLIAVDRRESMLDLARRLGATHTFGPDEAVREVKRLTDGRGVDVGVEAAGVQATLDLTSQLVRMEGALEVFGFHQGAPREVDWGYWNWMAFRVVNGHTRSAAVYVEGIRIGMGMLERGQLDMRPLVTHRFALADINRGFETASAKAEGFVKGVITFNGAA
ncbi:MAG TPA: zinc-binding dehydrogenase [Rubricoccaceae bacterium]|nr:zinc-binding dehydrogenase [Rubricoccaceae bacterium]